MNLDSSLHPDDQDQDSIGEDLLSIALIGPDGDHRKAIARVISDCHGGEIREFSSYPARLVELPRLLEQRFDVIVIDLDSDPEYALKLVEHICASSTATVMVYSEKADSGLLVRCMRAGAREFFTRPFAEHTVSEALLRVSSRRPAARPKKKAVGRLLAFLGAKGGDGVTTLACNFAVALAQESGQSTLLIDLDLPLGDAALNLGVVAEYSTINALQNVARLDSSFLSKLLVKHGTGVSVLAAPGKFPGFDAPNESIDKLLTVARQDFDNVVIDMGSRLDLMGTGLFKDSSTVYLVIQAGIAGLRNANRLISQYFVTDVPKLEIVLNRFQPRGVGVAEDQITKALTRPAQWKIPNDYAAVRRMQHTAIPLALEDSAISRLIRQMARGACGLPLTQEKSSGFSFKKIGRSLTSKISSTEEPQQSTQQDLTSDRDYFRASSTASQPETPAYTSAKTDFARVDETEPELEERPLLTAGGDATPFITTAEETEPSDLSIAPSQSKTPETRIYQGATYFRGEDGRWHLQPTQDSEVKEEAMRPEKETPAITWPAPGSVVYGTALSAAQLNATAPVEGRFSYNPAMGEILTPGVQTLSVEFAPSDAVNYALAKASVPITVTLATPEITWPTPVAISYGTALSAAQLNAASSVPGTLVYTPSRGEVLKAGEHTLSVSFTPNNSSFYRTAGAAVSLTVTKATPMVTWPLPAAISSGVPLSSMQLCATALVPGTLVYRPAAGEVLPAGTHTLSVSFTPADTADYTAVQTTVPITVTRATPVTSWPTLNTKPYGGAVVEAGSEPLAAKAIPVTDKKPLSPENSESIRVEPKAPAQSPAKFASKPAERPQAQPPVKAPSNASAKTAHRHQPQAPVHTPVETPANAMIKVGGPKAPLEVGPGLDLMGSAVLEDGTTIYLVMQPGSSGVANSNRLVSQFFSGKGPKPDFVINRPDARTTDAAGTASTALTRSAATPISRLIGQMARPSADESAIAEKPEKKAGFSLKGFGRSIWSKLSTADRAPSMTRLGLDADQAEPGTPAEPYATAGPHQRQAYTPQADNLLSPEEETEYMPAESAALAEAERHGARTAEPHSHRKAPETRMYMGALYVKGEDGQWHLQPLDAAPMPPAAPGAGAGELVAEYQFEFDEDTEVAKKPARKAKPAAKKSKAKASAKKPAKVAAKPASKAATKKPAKSAAKPAAKSPAKRTAKPAGKAPAKLSGKSAAKPAAKAAASRPDKNAAKPPARKAAAAKKKPANALKSKPTRNAPVPKPAVGRPAPEPVVLETPREPAFIEDLPGLVNESEQGLV